MSTTLERPQVEEQVARQAKKKTRRLVTTSGLKAGKGLVVNFDDQDRQKDTSWIKSKADKKLWRRLQEKKAIMEARHKAEVLSFLRVQEPGSGDRRLDINMEAVLERLEKSDLVVHDSLYYARKYRIMDRYEPRVQGHYGPDRATHVGVDDMHREPTWYEHHNAIHELVHAGSGQVFVLDRAGDDSIMRTTIGLQRNSRNWDNYNDDAYFTRLNEGMTEQITLSIMMANGYGDPPEGVLAYRGYLELFQEIIKVGGVSKKTILEAYFEEPDWHKLQQELSEKFGTHFLRKLDDEIRDRGDDCSWLLEKDENGRNGIQKLKDSWENQIRIYGDAKTVNEKDRQWESQQAAYRKVVNQHREAKKAREEELLQLFREKAP
jgi:hypothetical protein